MDIAEAKVFIAVDKNDEVEGIPTLKTEADKCVTKITQVPKLDVDVLRSHLTMGQRRGQHTGHHMRLRYKTAILGHNKRG